MTTQLQHMEHAAGPGGRGGNLTPTETRLLEVLREKPGRVFTRAELVALVMPETIVLQRTIDVHVGLLRQKLEPNPRHPQYLVTVHGLGYKFIG